MKTDEFEAGLRQALARRAAEIPQTAIDRLRRGNYRPRARNRVVMASAGLVTAAAVGAAVAVIALAPGSHPASPPPPRLAAWTVVKSADGNIYVRIRELRDPAGLQRRLRAEGLPASVSFVQQPNPSCRPYPADIALLNEVFPGAPRQPPSSSITIMIHPAALPSDAGVQLAADSRQLPAGSGVAAPSLVYASPQCTG